MQIWSCCYCAHVPTQFLEYSPRYIIAHLLFDDFPDLSDIAILLLPNFCSSLTWSYWKSLISYFYRFFLSLFWVKYVFISFFSWLNLIMSVGLDFLCKLTMDYKSSYPHSTLYNFSKLVNNIINYCWFYHLMHSIAEIQL